MGIEEITGPTETLARFASSIDFESLPSNVRHQAKRCLLDTVSAIIAGSRERVPTLLLNFCRKEGCIEEATVVLANLKTSYLNAALLNGTMAHCLEIDDGHRYAAGHPGAVIIPAALAAGELSDARGQDVLSGIVAGYEVFIRVAAAINPEHLRRGFHTTGTCGPLGASVAAGRILNLDSTQMENALGLAGLQGAGLLRVVESGAEAKPFQVGRASQSGLFAALLAERGLEAPREILEGSKGFVGAMAGKIDFEVMVNELGREFRLLQTYVKPYSACRHIHAAIDCAVALRSEGGFSTADVEEVSVRTYRTAIDLTGSIQNPKNLEQARFSLPYAMAIALGKDDFSQEFSRGLNDPEISNLARRVHISLDEHWENSYPRLRGSTVKVRLRNGTVLEQSVDVAKGEPENPVSDEELTGKLLGSAVGKTGEAEAKAIVQRIMTADRLARISELMMTLA